LANLISDTEVEELVAQAEEFHTAVETWIRTHHPAYVQQL